MERGPQLEENARRDTEPAAERNRETAPTARQDESSPQTIGRYEILGELGRGGVGVVYEAWDPQLERRVALKTLIAGRDASETQIERFLREVRATAHLRHPHIVAVHDAGMTGGRFFLAMDKIEGKPLDQILKEKGVLKPREAVKLLLPITRALEHAHQEGFIHRDVKPENILVDERGDAFLTDFGLALDLADSLRLTQSNQSLGTPAFMAPEQLRGRSRDPRVDIYAVGATLYECITGQVPFAGDSLPELMHLILIVDATPPRRLVPHIAPDLEAVALQCLEKNPALRYDSPAALARDLERFLAGEAVHASPPSVLRRMVRRMRRHRTLFVGATVAAVGLLAGLLASIWVYEDSASARRQKVRLEDERTRLLKAHSEINQRYTLEEARRAAFAEAALATSTQGQIEAYTRLLREYPDSWEGRLARARLLRVRCHELRARRGSAKQSREAALGAVEDIDQALAAATDPAPLLLLKAEVLRADLKDPDAARVVYAQLRQVADPSLSDYAQARLHLDAGRLSDANVLCQRALEIRPNLTPAQLLSAETLLALDRIDAALTQLERLSGNAISEAEVIRLRGQALLRVGRLVEARSDARRSRELDPTDPAVHLLLTRALLAQKNSDEALEAVNRGRALFPEHAHLALADGLAQVRADPNKLSKAIALVRLARSRGVALADPLLVEVRNAILEAARTLNINLDAATREALGADAG